METFSALLSICAGNSPVPGEFPAQRPVMRILDVFFDLRLNKRLSKQSWGWWFQTLSCPLWRHSNDFQHPALASNNKIHYSYHDLKDQYLNIKFQALHLRESFSGFFSRSRIWQALRQQGNQTAFKHPHSESRIFIIV